MFFATSRLGSRRNNGLREGAHLDVHEITDELIHPSRILFTEEVILGICMVITGLLFAFAQMPEPVLSTAASGKTIVNRSLASFGAMTNPATHEQGVVLMEAARPMFTALRRAQDLEERRDYGPAAVAAWREVARQLDELALQSIQMGQKNLPLWLYDAERSRIDVLEAKLAALAGPYRDTILHLRQQAITPEQAAALAIPVEQRTTEQQQDAAAVAMLMSVPWEAVAEVLPEPARSEARNYCQLLREAQRNATAIASHRGIINFAHWEAVAAAASTPEGMRAREAAARADRARDAGDFEAAQAAYEECLTAWQGVFMEHPDLRNDINVAEHVAEDIDAYQAVLSERGQPFDEAFSLPNVMRTDS
jgi:hypothetical protein